MFIFTIQGKRPTHDCHPPAILSPKQVFPTPHFSANQSRVFKDFLYTSKRAINLRLSRQKWGSSKEQHVLDTNA
jgi:hypothetical protein